MPGSVRVIKADSSDPMVISGQGMVSSLGLDASTSCAAARAGIRRAQPIDAMKFASIDGRQVECATGHPAPLITHGFEGAARLAQLITGALRDLSGSRPLPAGRKGLYLSMPSSRRHLTGADLVADPKSRQSFLTRIAEESSTFDDRLWTEKVLSLATRQAAVLKETPLRFVSYAGHTGFAEALAVAVEALQRSEIDLALVGGVDSLVEERCLKWLRLTGRLKGEANPAGLEPGEGAVFFAVERKQFVRQRQDSAFSQIGAIAIAEEERPTITGQQPIGRAFSDCIRYAAATAESLWLVSDHNGENSRGLELGNAMARVASHHSELLPAFFPAAVFGDTGSASGGMAACLTHGSFLRNYAPFETGVVASMADGPARSAFSLTSLHGS